MKKLECFQIYKTARTASRQGKTLTWDTDTDGNWAENVKGVDDYLVALLHKE